MIRLGRHRIQTGRADLKHPLLSRLLPASDRRLARQTLWLGAITGLQILGGVAQVAMSARILGPENYGALAVIVAVSTLVYGLLVIPRGEVVTTFVTRAVAEGRPAEAARILRFALAVSQGLALAAYAVIAALALAAGGLLGIDAAHRDAALLYGLVGVFMAAQAPNLALLRLADRLPLGLAAVAAGIAARIALLAAAWHAGGGLPAVVLAYAAGAAVAGAGLFLSAAMSAHRAGVAGLLRSASLKVPPDVARFQTGAFGRSALSALVYNMDAILLAQFAGAAEVGMYRGARQISDTARYPFQPLTEAAQPEYSRQWYAGRGAALRRTSLRLSLLSLALAAAIFGLVAVFHRPLTRLALGGEFADAAPLLLIMCLGSFIVTGVTALSALPAATGRIRPTLIAEAAGLAVFAAALLWLAPQYGAAGAAWAHLAYGLAFILVIIPAAATILKRAGAGVCAKMGRE